MASSVLSLIRRHRPSFTVVIRLSLDPILQCAETYAQAFGGLLEREKSVFCGWKRNYRCNLIGLAGHGILKAFCSELVHGYSLRKGRPVDNAGNFSGMLSSPGLDFSQTACAVLFHLMCAKRACLDGCVC